MKETKESKVKDNLKRSLGVIIPLLGVIIPLFNVLDRVNDRQGGNQRFHSEPHHRNDGLQSLAPAGAKGGGAAVFSEDGRSILYNSRHRDAFRQQSEKVAARQKSLPARKPSGEFCIPIGMMFHVLKQKRGHLVIWSYFN